MSRTLTNLANNSNITHGIKPCIFTAPKKWLNWQYIFPFIFRPAIVSRPRIKVMVNFWPEPGIQFRAERVIALQVLAWPAKINTRYFSSFRYSNSGKNFRVQFRMFNLTVYLLWNYVRDKSEVLFESLQLNITVYYQKK